MRVASGRRSAPGVAAAAAACAAVVVALGIAPASTRASATSRFFDRLTSHRSLPHEHACGRSPDSGDGTRIVFARGVRCHGPRHGAGDGALGVISVELGDLHHPDWTCTSFETRDSYLLCYHGRLRQRISDLEAALQGTHIRAVS
jgi:hypothetical protein